MKLKILFAITSIILIVMISISCQKATEPGDNYTGDVIAYCYNDVTSRGTIYGINADGTNNRILIGGTADVNHHDYSPDGTKFVLVRYYPSTQSILTCNIDGSSMRRLTTTQGVLDYDPAFSPDGTKIAFTRAYQSVPGDFSSRRYELWIMNADGSNQQYIGIDGYAPEWSPDGTKLIYASNKTARFQIYTCNINGTNETRITNSNTNDTYPAFSPDGTKIVFNSTSFSIYSNESTAMYEICIMNSDGTNRRQLTTNTDCDIYPRWSPDGSKISFNSDKDSKNKHPVYSMSEVYTMNQDGTEVKRITNSPQNVSALNPVWRPRR